MKRVRGGTIFYLYCGVLEPKKRVRGGTLIKAVLKRSTKEQGQTLFGGGSCYLGRVVGVGREHGRMKRVRGG